jgi:hypothetical protein
MIAIKPSQVAGDALERKGEWEGIRKTSRSCCLGYMDRRKRKELLKSILIHQSVQNIILSPPILHHQYNFLALSHRKAHHRASI